MSGGSNAPTAYQPANQAGADASYQSFVNDLGNAYTGAAGVSSSLANTAAQVQANPYAATAQSGANQVAALSPLAAQYAFGGAQNAGQAAQGANQAAYATQGIASGQNAAAQQQYALGGLAQPLATQINQTAFDPQAALYNQQYAANQNQSAVSSAMNGVAGSPFAAGLQAQSGQNFNLNWQNQQLSRQTQGASAIDALINAGVGAYGAGVTSQGQAASSLAQGVSDQTAGVADTTQGISDVGQGLTTLAQGSALPSNTFLTQQNANIAALQAAGQGYAAQGALASAGTAADATYLGLGQSATQVTDQATAQNNAQQNAAWSGLLSAGGMAADIFS